MVEDFDEKDRMELMAIDKSGTVIITSSGFSPTEQLDMPDYTQALSSPSRDSFAYDTLNGESVLAYTLLAPTVDDSNISALRYVVSLTAVKRQIYVLIAAAGVVGAAIIFLSSCPALILSIPSSTPSTRCARLPCKSLKGIFLPT